MKTTEIYELTLRDGLMARPALDQRMKVEIVERLLQCSIKNFEVIRFPLDGKYPQFDEGLALLEVLQPLRKRGAVMAAFAMGEAGINEAIRFGEMFDELHIPCFVSDSYAAYAFGDWCWDKSLRLIERTASLCREANVKLTIGLGTSFGCPLRKGHKTEWTLEKVRDLTRVGVNTVMLGDTAGTATPHTVRETIIAVNDGPRPETVRVHFHNTFGRALMNSWAAWEVGVDGIDTSLLGLGGEPHPYFISPGQVDNGNCATEEIFPLIIGGAGTGTAAANSLYETARWLSDSLKEMAAGRACFAEFVPLTDGGSDEISQGTYRH
jgi:hydroxymethylglutaryl-CoA lyase